MAREIAKIRINGNSMLEPAWDVLERAISQKMNGETVTVQKLTLVETLIRPGMPFYALSALGACTKKVKLYDCSFDVQDLRTVLGLVPNVEEITYQQLISEPAEFPCNILRNATNAFGGTLPLVKKFKWNCVNSSTALIDVLRLTPNVESVKVHNARTLLNIEEYTSGNFTSLRELSFNPQHQLQLSDCAAIQALGLRLRKIELTNIDVTNERVMRAVASLLGSQLQWLVDVNLASAQESVEQSDIAIDVFRWEEFPSVVKLEITSTFIHSSTRWEQSFPQLKELVVCSAGEREVTHVEFVTGSFKNYALRSLCVLASGVSRMENAIRVFPMIERLELSADYFSDVLFQYVTNNLPKLKTLIALSPDGEGRPTTLSNQSLFGVQQSTELVKLDLAWVNAARINDFCVSAFRGLVNLRQLTLPRCNISAVGLSLLMQKCKTLTHLDTGRNVFQEDTIHLLQEANTSIRILFATEEGEVPLFN